jgi:hypothetical protein
MHEEITGRGAVLSNQAAVVEVASGDVIVGNNRFEEVAFYVGSISREAAFDTRFKAGESDVRVLT